MEGYSFDSQNTEEMDYEKIVEAITEKIKAIIEMYHQYQLYSVH